MVVKYDLSIVDWLLPNVTTLSSSVPSAFSSNLFANAWVLLLLTFCLLLLPLWESIIVICFVVRCFVSILVLQSS